MPKAVLDSSKPQAARASANDQRTGEDRNARPVGRALCIIFKCQTAEFHRPQFWSGLGFARLFFRSPKARGRGAPEQTPEEGTRLSSAPPAFPAFAFHGARTRASP